MTRLNQTGGGTRTRQLRAAFHQAKIARTRSDMFDKAGAFIDDLLLSRDNPAQLAATIELIAASQYGGPAGSIAEKSRLAVQKLLATPECMDCRRILLNYL